MANSTPQGSSTSRVVEFDAVLEQNVETSHVEARRIFMKAGTAAGRHIHNCPVVGTVLSGGVLLQVAGHPAQLLRAGDAFYEPAGVPIYHFDARDDDIEFLAFFLLRNGETPEAIFTD